MPALLLLVFSLFLLYLFFSSEYFIVSLYRAYKNSNKSKPFHRQAKSPIIGIFGDSTGVGVGASNPKNSFAGLIAKHYPSSTIINKSVSRLQVRHVSKLLKQETQCYDLLFLCCVGNDFLYNRNLKQVKKDLEQLLFIAKSKGKKVFFVAPLNASLSMIVPWFLKKFYLVKCKKIGLILDDEAKKYPNIIIENNLLIDDPFLIPSYRKICDQDGVHPNNLGYLWIYYKIKTKLPNL